MKEERNRSKSSLRTKAFFVYISLTIVVVAILVVAIFLLRKEEQGLELRDYQTLSLEIADQELDVWVADTEKKRRIGLGVVEDLEENQGMLFLFDGELTPTFWMKGVSYPLDIIWLNDKKVVQISKNCPPDGGEKKYSPSEEVDSVLEVAGGFSEKYDALPGTVLQY